MREYMEIRNNQGKLVCKVERNSKTVEIAVKGYVTLVKFCEDGNINVINKNKAV
ncbi:MAG: hypothetical protein NC311_08570 [Muribaculaceae bacterium]|nr:hypothetical protein [Muribaculaceae bacterium]